MFLLDDILLAPFNGLVAICRKIEQSARQDLETREKAAMGALGELHGRLELGQINDQDFEMEETRLLDQLEALRNVLHPQEADQPD